jgi:hypothetical protein
MSFSVLTAAFDAIRSSRGCSPPCVAKVEKPAGSWRHIPQYEYHTGREVLFKLQGTEVTIRLQRTMRPGNSVYKRPSWAVPSSDHLVQSWIVDRRSVLAELSVETTFVYPHK